MNPDDIYELHPLCEMFPPMSKAELAALADDIKANGLSEPITLFEGKILDGRHRYQACGMAGATLRICQIEEYEDDDFDAVAFVLSKNLHRRHLSESQRSVIASKIANMNEGRPGVETAQICAVSQAKAAEMLNVSRRSVQSAKTVIDNGTPELTKAVEANELSVSAAADLVTAIPDKAAQAAIVAKGSKAVKEAIKAAKPKKEAPKTHEAPQPQAASKEAERNEDCPKGQQHEWENDDATGERFCKKCLEPCEDWNRDQEQASASSIKNALAIVGSLPSCYIVAFIEALAAAHPKEFDTARRS